LLLTESNSTTALKALKPGFGGHGRNQLEWLMRDTGRTGMPIDVRPQMPLNQQCETDFFVPA